MDILLSIYHPIFVINSECQIQGLLYLNGEQVAWNDELETNKALLERELHRSVSNAFQASQNRVNVWNTFHYYLQDSGHNENVACKKEQLDYGH